MELETEVKKLSGQQNIQQRIHHHAKIKVRIGQITSHFCTFQLRTYNKYST